MTPTGPNFTELIAKTLGMLAAFILCLFVPAGTSAWPSAWLYVAISSAFSIGLTAWLLQYDPALLAERLTGLRQSDRKKGDKILVRIIAGGFFVWLALMGLEAGRFHWSYMPVWLQAVGLIFLLSSFYIFYLTFRENTYLSPAVRIQKERGQKVISSGPYRYVRHPMYAGFVLYVIGTALMLGSWVGFTFGLLLIAAVARRAIFEEQTLERELPGYSEYMRRVRYRFVPQIW